MTILSGICIFLLVISGFLMTCNRIRELKPFNRDTTDPLRGILALLIVLHHISLQIHIPLIGEFAQNLGIPIVSLFFLLSGYGLGISYLTKGSSYLNKFLSRRYSKILPSFLILTFIAIIIDTLCGKKLSNQIHELVVNGETPLPFSWFIYAIIYIYASFYVSAILGKNPRQTGLYLLGCNIIYILLTSIVGNYGFWWYVTIPSVNLGYYIAIYEKSLTSYIQKYPIIVYSTAIMMVFISIYGVTITPSLKYLPGLIWRGFWALNIAGGCYLIIRTLGLIRWKPLIWLSAISMEIYLIHGLPIRSKFLFAGMSDILYVFFVYTLSIFTAWLIHKIINTKFINFFKRTSSKSHAYTDSPK